jgi:hypothetical protein
MTRKRPIIAELKNSLIAPLVRSSGVLKPLFMLENNTTP